MGKLWGLLMSNNLIQEFFTISQQVQQIESRIQGEQVSDQSRVALHKELESLQDGLGALKQNAFSTQQQARLLFSQFDEMEGQIISLYRKVEESFEQYEVSLISKGALKLSDSLLTGKTLEVSKQIDEIKHNIHFLFQHRRPSMQNRKIILLSMKLSEQADATIHTTGHVSKAHMRMVQTLKSLLREAIASEASKATASEMEFAMELYEIAELFLHKKEKEAKVRLSCIKDGLTPAQKKRLEKAKNTPRELVQILLEIADGDPCVEQRDDSHAKIFELHG